MICPYCKEIIDDDSRFCDHCGRALSSKESRPKKKWPIVLAAVLALLVIIAAVVLLLLKPWKGDAFEDYIRQGDAGNAVTYYEENISGKAEKEQSAKEFLTDYLRETLKAYESGDSSQENWNSAYETVKKADKSLNLVSDELTAAKDEALAVEASKESYQKGQEDLKNKQYLNAGAALAQVIPEDAENYANAQQGLQDMRENYMAELKKTADSYIKDKKYDAVLALADDAQSVYGDTDEISGIRESTPSGKYEKQINEAMQNADYSGVVSAYQEAHVTQKIAFDEAFTDKVESWIRRNAIAGAEAAAEKSDYDTAVSVLKKALAAMPEDEELTALSDEMTQERADAQVRLQYEKKINEAMQGADYSGVVSAYQEAHVTQGVAFDETFTDKVESWIRRNAIAGAKAAAEKGDYSTALRVVEKALAALPGDEELTALQAQLNG